jgi:hypothetical protein
MLVITVLTIIVVAFMQSMTVERQTATSYSNRYRAELAAKAALAEALGRLEHATTDSQFHYVVTTENPDTNTEYLKLIPKVAGNVDADTANEINLAIVPGETDTSGTVDMQLTAADVKTAVKRTTAWKQLLDTSKNEEIGRYSFWTGEAAGKQDLQVHSGIGTRKQAEDLLQIPLVKATGTAFSEPEATLLQPYQNVTKVTDRKNLPTVETGNQIVTPSPLINDRDFTLRSSTAILTPEGKPRINLTRLKAYIDGGTYQEVDENSDPANPTFTAVDPPVPGGLPLTQGPSSPRFQLVKDLLNEDGQHGAEKENPWGYGNLEIVKKIFPGTNGDLTQARQFVANLLDYIDDDLIPTTDGQAGPDPGTGGSTGDQNVSRTLPNPPPPAPTVMGVEARYDSSKQGIIGHPYIVYVGQGFIFNFGNSGFINSSRVMGWVGMAYPWDADTTWRKGGIDTYRVEMQVALNGTAQGSRGSTIMATSASNGYFQPNWLAQKSGSFSPGATDALNTPLLIGKAHSYFIYPRVAAGGFDLANGYFTINQPLKGLEFDDLTTTIQTLRVIYRIPGDSTRYLVQDLSTLSSLPRKWSTPTFKPDTSQYKLGGTYGQQDWHFNGDPRLNFLSEGWRLDSTSGTTIVKAASGVTDYYAAADNARKDPLQSFTGDADKWWQSSDQGLANHFMVKDATREVNPLPSPDIDEPAMHSYAELGFIHAGKPWQTLTLFNDGTRFASKDSLDHADWKLLDYIDLGIQPRHANPNEQREVIGQINVNTGQKVTLQALLKDIPSVPDPQPLVDQLLSGDASLATGNNRPYLTPSAIFANPDFKNNATTDPGREELVGRLFPALTTHSQKFLVHCRGEALLKGKTVAQVDLVAEVELGYTPESIAAGAPKIKPTILRTYYR